MKNLLFIIIFVVSILLPFTNINAQSFFEISNFSTSNDDEFLDVNDAFAFNFLQQDNKLVINFDVQEGYYLYQHQFKFTPENASISPVDLPVGTEYDDASISYTHLRAHETREDLVCRLLLEKDLFTLIFVSI